MRVGEGDDRPISGGRGLFPGRRPRRRGVKGRGRGNAAAREIPSGPPAGDAFASSSRWTVRPGGTAWLTTWGTTSELRSRRWSPFKELNSQRPGDVHKRAFWSGPSARSRRQRKKRMPVSSLTNGVRHRGARPLARYPTGRRPRCPRAGASRHRASAGPHGRADERRPASRPACSPGTA